jgi:hypothetical protein
MTNPFPLKMAGFELPTSGRLLLPGDTGDQAEKIRRPFARGDASDKQPIFAVMQSFALPQLC